MNVCGILKLRALLFSSNWNNAGNAGTFNFNANNAASNSNTNIGRQIVNFVNYVFTSIYPAPWQNITTNKHCVGRT